MSSADGEHESVKLSCPSKGASARGSSTWKHDTRKFGPQNALDSASDAAWKSAPSEEVDPMAYYEIYFHRPVSVKEMRVQFQGGFVGMDCIVYQKKSSNQTTTTTNEGSSSGEQQRNNDDKDVEWEEFDELFVEPQDSIEIQTFPVDEMESDEDEAYGTCTALRMEFGKSTDFYGRIVIYSLEIWGTEA
mmetsp:Transcript_38968/g.81530  ORF Transcript_38968/g.81530 Transcript_38968/m.81530 type:complete len:189 (+) Transcript_38968:135-701(+)